MIHSSCYQSFFSILYKATQCGYNGNWYLFNGNCYMLNPTSGPNATMTWYDSSDYCNGNNAQLVSIHSLDENNFIQGLVSICLKF